MLGRGLFVLLALGLGAVAQQAPMQLSSLGTSAFTTLANPRFPNHRIRIKQSAFCDPTINVYTGYLDVDEGAKHLFFYFFESRRDPAKDDVVMWINGGPGVGVGFSYADFGETVETTEDAAKNIYSFISLFFEAFPQYEGRGLHLSGESYGGRYLPIFASKIYDQNKLAEAAGGKVINLKSVIIGNGITDISTLYPGRYEIECGRAALDVPFQTIGNRVRMKQALARCQKLM
ncbi:Carboxypeptidase [Mycena kentingensis (nom. inval.)]|nr:Carboxypeptidase [Mycena kentingensis (nom. inval.)]